MSKHNTNETVSQEPKFNFLEAVDKNGVSIVVEGLSDEKYPWRERKLKNLQLADIYVAAGMQKERDRAVSCSLQLEYLAMADGRRTLMHGRFCQLRLCPICSARRAKKAALQLSRILDWTESQHPGTKYLFLTLTVKNCTAEQLSDTITLLLNAFKKLCQHRSFKRAVKGWYRALEITLSGNTYHPHLHVILAVEPEYFKRNSGLYITQADWEAHWQAALGVTYRPRVDIRAAHSKGAKKANVASAVEAAKYAVKDTDYLKPGLPTKQAVEVVQTYSAALKGRRVVGFGGWFKEAVKALKIDEDCKDLVHIDDEAVREDVAELAELYGWSFGWAHHVLWNRVPYQQGMKHVPPPSPEQMPPPPPWAVPDNSSLPDAAEVIGNGHNGRPEGTAP